MLKTLKILKLLNYLRCLFFKIKYFDWFIPSACKRINASIYLFKDVTSYRKILKMHKMSDFEKQLYSYMIYFRKKVQWPCF